LQQLRERLRTSEGTLQTLNQQGLRRTTSDEREFAPFTLFDDPSAPLDLEGRTPQTPLWRRKLQNAAQFFDTTSIRVARLVKMNSNARVFGLVYFVLVNILVLFYLLSRVFSSPPSP
jgi:hypothetical protein